MLTSFTDLAEIVQFVFPDQNAPKPFPTLFAALRVRDGADAAAMAAHYHTTRKRVMEIAAASDPVAALLGGAIPPLTEELSARTRRKLGELLLGAVAERVFTGIYKEKVHSQDFQLEDDREDRSDTDYRILNGKGRPVFRVNIKFHGSPFRKATEMVNLDPTDCFALATYKIHAGLQKQDQQHLPFVFLIVGVPDLRGTTVGEEIPENLVHITALPTLVPAVKGKRNIEDAVVRAMERSAEAQPLVIRCYERIRNAPWYVLSAKRALNLLTQRLFERCYALRVRGFAQNYRNAELDMHFSLSQDLTPLPEFLRVMSEDGLAGLVARLTSGTF